MTIDAPRCKEILQAVDRTGQNVRVTFNYRYAPHNTKIFEILQSGAIGKVTSVHFEWMLNTSHGADYFRRWHRDKRNSGGLLVHKSTHHFDLVNFWLQTRPQTVYAQGDLKFYGRENAEQRGVTEFYTRSHGSKAAESDPFALHMERIPNLKAMYLDAEHEDAYYRDQSVFGDGINIEDTMNLLVTYKNGAVMTYSLTAYAPWEGFRVNFNGTGGRLEVEVVENSYVNSGGDQVSIVHLPYPSFQTLPLDRPVQREERLKNQKRNHSIIRRVQCTLTRHLVTRRFAGEEDDSAEALI